MKQLIISGGKYKNTVIRCPAGEIRPAMNIMREAIFQILNNHYHLPDFNNNLEQSEDKALSPQGTSLTFLDLFSGSGLMAIEAVSRGITKAMAVEIDKIKWHTIQENLAIDKEALTLAKSPAERFLMKNTKAFDIIYTDPPFRYAYKDDLMHKIVSSRSCSPTSLVIIHLPKREQLSHQYQHFTQIDYRTYGGSSVYFYKQCQ